MLPTTLAPVQLPAPALFSLSHFSYRSPPRRRCNHVGRACVKMSAACQLGTEQSLKLHGMKTITEVSKHQLLQKRHSISASYLCASARMHSSRCAAARQTQTITRESSTATISPLKGKEKSPMLDDGGTGFPPRQGGGGGGGGGGGQNFSGGFWFFAILLFLRILKDTEKESSYGNDRRR